MPEPAFPVTVARIRNVPAEAEIIIARNGRPAARLVPLAARPTQRRIGIAAGQFKVPESIDLSNAELEHLFIGDPNP